MSKPIQVNQRVPPPHPLPELNPLHSPPAPPQPLSPHPSAPHTQTHTTVNPLLHLATMLLDNWTLGWMFWHFQIFYERAFPPATPHNYPPAPEKVGLMCCNKIDDDEGGGGSS